MSTEDYDYSEIPEEQEDIDNYCAKEGEESSKKYINRLRSFDVNKEVIVWVENAILSLDRRKHKFDDPTLAAYIIQGYKALGKEVRTETIIRKTGTMDERKRVLSLMSGESTENSTILDTGMGVLIEICSPVDFIEEILIKFYEKKNIEINKSSMKYAKGIIKFSHVLFQSINKLQNYEPKSLACAFVFFYLEYAITIQPKLKILEPIKKTHFKTLSISSKKTTDVNPKDFDACYEIIKKYFNMLADELDEEELRELLRG